MTVNSKPFRSDPITRVGTLVPFALAVWVDVFARPFFGGLSKTPELAGLSAGMWLQVAFLAWGGIGVYVVWTTRSRVKAALAFVLCTPVAIIGIVAAPVVTLVLEKLGT
jgi:hypothetical protein